MQSAFRFEAPLKEAAAPARKNLVIEAGAGTGKTTAIVAEVLRLMLENEELAPERIVLVTFTEKAAGEIADRIRGALTELDAAVNATGPAAPHRVTWPIGSAHPLLDLANDDALRRACSKQLARIDSLRSQTIHSFCQSLLRTFPIEAGLDPQFKIIEGFERSLLYGQLYDAWLDRETRVDPQPAALVEWEFLFAHVGYLFQIRDLIFSLLERRDLLSETAYDLGEFTEVEPSLRTAVGTLRFAELEQLSEYFRAVTEPRGADLDEWIAYLGPVARSIRELNLPKGNANKEAKEALNVLRAGAKGRSIYDRLVSHRGALALQALTRRFVEFLDQEKRRLGVVDFDDLLLRTLEVLRNDEVIERARAQFDFIFVDEFQDTDRTQARIIDLLARDRDGKHVAGKTIVVGDPKQSIYGFRRADPETYYRMTEELRESGAERRVIVDQYRSDPPLLEAINAMFGCLFPPVLAHDPNVFRPAYHALRAGKPGPRLARDAHVTLLHAASEERSDRFFTEGEAIAEWILRQDGNDLRRFAILFRRLTKIDDYLDTLDRYDIKYVLPPTRMFLDRRAPVDLVAVLRAIAYPFDKGAEISAARTPYFALTDAEIAEGFSVAPNVAPPLQAAGSPADDDAAWRGGATLKAFRAALDAYREASSHLTVSQLIDHVLATTGIESIYDAAADGLRHLRHLEHVRAIAFEYDQKIGGSVRQFVDEIARRRGEPDEMEPSLADDTENAVRILSVHAAKGLEFDTVILPDLAFSTTNPDLVQLFTVEEPRSLVMAGRCESISGNFRYTSDEEKLKKIAGFREEAETRRLFYVAVTRAKSEVVFVCNTGEETKHAGFFRCLGDVMGVKKNDLATMFPASGREVRPTAIGGVVVPVAFERVEARAAGERRRPRLRDQHVEQQLAGGEIVELAIPHPAALPRLEPAEIARRRTASRNRNAGILMHRFLEVWDLTSEPEPLLRQLAAEVACEADDFARVRAYVATIRRSPMLARLRAAETIGRELPVHLVDERGKVSERRIDRLIRESDSDVVIDYKSGRREPAREERNKAQIRAYCDALAAISGRKCSGLLWYIDAGGDEIVDVS
jgi:ATP-dependent helicase/nuclease subunit A